MSDGQPTLEVGFAINPEGSFEQLRQLQAAMDSTEGRIVAEAARIEQATSGMVKLGGATAQIVSFGNAYTREMESLRQSNKRTESAGESLVRQLDRQIMTFGKSTAEIRQMRVEMRALAAEDAGLTELAARVRAAGAEIDRLESGIGRVGATSGRSRGTMMQFGMQMNDVATMAALGSPPMQIFASQIGQIVQLAQGAEGGVRGFAGELGGLLLRFGPLIAVVAVAAAGFALFNRAVTSDIDTKPMIDSLGLTRAEIKRLKDTSVDTGDVMKATFQVLMERVGFNMAGVKEFFGDAMNFLTTAGRNTLSALYTMFVGTFRAIASVVKNVKEGDFENILSDMDKAVADTYKKANAAQTQFGKDVRSKIISNKQADLEKQAREIKLDRTPKKDSDTRAENLAREAQAIEAQIRNLYTLADAYGVSGAAALIAEARVKAESEAIKKRADIEERVARQVRLAVAQRISDAAKATAAVREQADLQELVNAEVRAGNVHAAQASDLLRDRIADLPLLAALEAARITGDAKGAAAAADALDRQREARDRLTDAERKAQMLAARQDADDRLAMLREELRLIGATEEVRVRELATLRATQEAKARGFTGSSAADLIKTQVDVAVETERLAAAQRNYNAELSFTADKWDIVANKVQSAASGMAEAFGSAGRAIGDLASIYANYHADRTRAELEHRKAVQATGGNQVAIARENQKFALRSSGAQIQAYGDMVSAAKGFFKEGSAGYKALAAAEKVYRIAQLAMSLQAMVQSALETTTIVAGAAARATAEGTAGIAAQSKLPFPLNLVAMAATGAALVAAGISVFAGGGGGSSRPTGNIGTGTVLGDSEAKSESIKRAIDALKEVDTVMLSYSRQMAASLRSIDSQIGNVASLVVRAGKVNASAGVNEGFKTNSPFLLLNQIPIIGGIIKSLFGTTTKVVGSGLFGDAQSLGSILNDGFDASYFSDVQKKKKFLGINYSTKYRTQFADADAGLESQFTLILRSFSDAIKASAGPLGASTDDVVNRLNGFVVNIGKIDLKDLSGEEIQEKLSAVFGAAADQMAAAAFPGIDRFQKVGEGAFETLVRVASTVEAVTEAIGMLGEGARTLSLDAKVALADQFDTIGDLTSATGAYFERFYSQQEQSAARSAQFARVFTSLGLAMPASLASFRQLVEAQNLTTDAGRSTYATLLQLAPAFADLQEAMNGARSAADILAERSDLERKLLEVQGNTEALRALDLAKLDASNRALQQQIYSLQDAQEAARAADELRRAWTDVGKSIAEEVRRIRGFTDPSGNGSFASLSGQFNASTIAARGGDQEAAKLLPGLSQALLKAAADAATSRQELERVQAQTAASLEATLAAINAMGAPATASSTATALLAAMSASQGSTSSAAPANDTMASELAALRAEIAGMRTENNAGHAATASAGNRTAKVLETVTAQSGGDAVNVASAA